MDENTIKKKREERKDKKKGIRNLIRKKSHILLNFGKVRGRKKACHGHSWHFQQKLREAQHLNSWKRFLTYFQIWPRGMQKKTLFIVF